MGVRTFVAVDLPDEIRSRIREIQEEFRGFSLKLVDPELLHVTLKFLGDVEEERIEDIKNALDGVRCRPFFSEVRGIGSFGDRVIWIGTSNFEKLHELTDLVLSPLGFEREKRFNAHATIARIKKMHKKEKVKLKNKIRELSGTDLGKMEVKEVKLKKSILRPTGPIYEDLYVKNL
ncbi:MAG: RNA 2',3'-cyclic phosphodiesterase [Candidatus Syntropharchaeia archaeon]